MKLFKKNENKETVKLPMSGKVKKGFRFYCVAARANDFGVGTFMSACSTSAPPYIGNNHADFLFRFILCAGHIYAALCVVQIGLSLKSHDPSQRANGFLTLAGGVVITFAKEILTLITG